MKRKRIKMTANELADEIEDYECEIGVKFSKTIGTMLRQQAQEIIDLECEKERQREKITELEADLRLALDELDKEVAESSSLQDRWDELVQEIENLKSKVQYWKGFQK